MKITRKDVGRDKGENYTFIVYELNNYSNGYNNTKHLQIKTVEACNFACLRFISVLQVRIWQFSLGALLL